MPRNAQGQYFLPDGNPVTPGELIKAEWANSTMDDIASALTNSLDRAGAGGMTGQFKAAAGSVTRPGISFGEDTSSGIFKQSSQNIGGVAGGKQSFYWTPTGLYVNNAPADKMQVVNKGYVDGIAAQATQVVGSFGKSRTPAELPTNGYIPANWDAVGVPAYSIQLTNGQSMVYRPTDTTNPLYDHVFVYVGTNFVASGWVDIGAVEGPVGPQGEQGPKGDIGPEGPIGPQGPTGQTGAMGPAGPQGIQGPTGPQGQQGSPGASCTIVGSFGKSKTPADLPVSGLIPKDWDSVGNPPAAYQMKTGEALIYTECPKTTADYGHVYEFVPDSVSTFDLNNWVDIGDIVGPQGPAGKDGAQGPTGPQGPAGKNGADGAQGPAGDPGPAGKDGAQGPAGAAGPTGPKGDPGQSGTPATGGGTDKVFMMNDQTITTSYDIPGYQNAASFGPIKVNPGAVIGIPTTSTWTVI